MHDSKVPGNKLAGVFFAQNALAKRLGTTSDISLLLNAWKPKALISLCEHRPQTASVIFGCQLLDFQCWWEFLILEVTCAKRRGGYVSAPLIVPRYAK